MNQTLVQDKNCYLVLSQNAQGKKAEAEIKNTFLCDILAIRSITNLDGTTLEEFRYCELQIINPKTNSFIVNIPFEEIHVQLMNPSRGYIRRNIPMQNLSSVIIRVSPEVHGDEFEFQLNYAFLESSYPF
jgi:hypothetical protein